MTEESWIKTGVTSTAPVAVIASSTEKKSLFDNGSADETLKGLDVLVYGDSNTGKSYFASTFPEPIYFIDTEGRANKTRQFHFPGKVIKISSPMEIRENYKTEKELENAVDMEKSVDNLINALVEISNEAKAGKIKGGTVVIDSATDVWKWVQEEGKFRLAKAGKIDMVQFRLKSQFDWGGITNKYLSFLLATKKLTELGINVVMTAREKKVPDYVKDNTNPSGLMLFEEKINTQKDTAYQISTIINLDLKNFKTTEGMKQKRFAKIEKLESISGDFVEIENITYEKLKAVVDEKRAKLIGGNKA